VSIDREPALAVGFIRAIISVLPCFYLAEINAINIPMQRRHRQADAVFVFFVGSIRQVVP
jgi:hypothetical protein